MLNIDTDQKADAIYIKLSDEPIGYSQELDSNRIIDYALNPGKLIGVDLLAVSQGVKLSGLPTVKGLEELLTGLGVRVIKD